jgi:hypothetical protein
MSNLQYAQLEKLLYGTYASPEAARTAREAILALLPPGASYLRKVAEALRPVPRQFSPGYTLETSSPR